MHIQPYLQRIHYTGPAEPTLDVLRSLQEHHLLHVPFENLDIHYQRAILLDTGKFYHKIVEKKRGGFCYELNGLFYILLVELGFTASIISARVFTREGEYSPEYDHLAILVTIDGRNYLSDVGFGEFAFTPLEIKEGIVQQDRRGNFIIDCYDETYFRVSKETAGKYVPEYIFSLTERPLTAFEQMCHYHQSDERSHFKQRKLITLPTSHGRITIAGNKLKVTSGNNSSIETVLDEDGFQQNLLKYFGITM